MNPMIEWNAEKNLILKKERGLCFEDVEEAILNNDIIDIVPHHNQSKYPDQELLIVKIKGRICYVPFVSDQNKFFLKTIIPSRKYRKNLKR